MMDLSPHESETEEAPLTILSAQASLLGSKTENIVVAKVIQAETPYGFYKPPRYDFFLIAIPLEYFHHRLFTVKCSNESYPVIFFFDEKLERELKSKLGEWKGKLKAKSAEAFMSILSEIFHSERTHELIGSLLLLSEEFCAEQTHSP